jgi:hypothetical protein
MLVNIQHEDVTLGRIEGLEVALPVYSLTPPNAPVFGKPSEVHQGSCRSNFVRLAQSKP